VIAHRGFSAENPENTLISYENAVKAGTSALEGGNFYI
jgi:phosphatidylglycerol phospholipase C